MWVNILSGVHKDVLEMDVCALMSVIKKKIKIRKDTLYKSLKTVAQFNLAHTYILFTFYIVA